MDTPRPRQTWIAPQSNGNRDAIPRPNPRMIPGKSPPGAGTPPLPGTFGLGCTPCPGAKPWPLTPVGCPERPLAVSNAASPANAPIGPPVVAPMATAAMWRIPPKLPRKPIEILVGEGFIGLFAL